MVYTLPILGKLLQSLSRNPWWPEVRSGGGGDGKRYQIGLGIGGRPSDRIQKDRRHNHKAGPIYRRGFTGQVFAPRIKTWG